MEGITFDILCDTDFGSSTGNNALQISYTTDFPTCINACVTWNKMRSQKCVGVTWEEAYGPLGVDGGRECRYFWTLIGNFASPGTDSAFIQDSISPTVRSYVIDNSELMKTKMNSLPPPQPTNMECLEIQGTTYTSITGTKVDAICGTNWYGNDLHLTFTLDFLSCINGCAEWNSNNTEKCIGVAWVSGNYGPDGLSGGCQCYYKWDMPGTGTSDSFISSAKLINVTQNSPVEFH